MTSSLHAVRVAVTRPVEGADELSETLRARGADVVQIPLVIITGAHDPAPLERALADLDGYDWIVFTSANAVRVVARALEMSGRAAVHGGRVVAVGPATAAAVTAQLGWHVDVVPATHTGDAVVGAMKAAGDVKGRRVLWPRARGARDAVRRDLAAAGAVLDEPEAYGSDPVPEAAHELALLLERGEVDVITLTSPGAVAALIEAEPRLSGCIVAVIGGTTRAAAESAGMDVHVKPAEHTIGALVDELERYLARTRSNEGQ